MKSFIVSDCSLALWLAVGPKLQGPTVSVPTGYRSAIPTNLPQQRRGQRGSGGTYIRTHCWRT